MNLQMFLERRALEKAPQQRALCLRCRQSPTSCYCAELRPFHPQLKIVLLVHPHEARRRIGTGRMSHLSLKESQWIVGEDFGENERVDQLISEANGNAFVLYPGAESSNMSQWPQAKRAKFLESQATLFVLDGTWVTARKMLQRSSNLLSLPRLSFDLPGPSQFRIRKQPASYCLSTIEALHHLLHLLNGEPNEGSHHDLLIAFRSLVHKQVQYTPGV